MFSLFKFNINTILSVSITFDAVDGKAKENDHQTSPQKHIKSETGEKTISIIFCLKQLDL